MEPLQGGRLMITFAYACEFIICKCATGISEFTLSHDSFVTWTPGKVCVCVYACMCVCVCALTDTIVKTVLMTPTPMVA